MFWEMYWGSGADRVVLQDAGSILEVILGLNAVTFAVIAAFSERVRARRRESIGRLREHDRTGGDDYDALLEDFEGIALATVPEIRRLRRWSLASGIVAAVGTLLSGYWLTLSAVAPEETLAVGWFLAHCTLFALTAPILHAVVRLRSAVAEELYADVVDSCLVPEVIRVLRARESSRLRMQDAKAAVVSLREALRKWTLHRVRRRARRLARAVMSAPRRKWQDFRLRRSLREAGIDLDELLADPEKALADLDEDPMEPTDEQSA